MEKRFQLSFGTWDRLRQGFLVLPLELQINASRTTGVSCLGFVSVDAQKFGASATTLRFPDSPHKTEDRGGTDDELHARSIVEQ